MVGCEKGLAFGPVDDKGIDAFAFGWRKLHVRGLIKPPSKLVRRIRTADHEDKMRLSVAMRKGARFLANGYWRGSRYELRIRPRK